MSFSIAVALVTSWLIIVLVLWSNLRLRAESVRSSKRVAEMERELESIQRASPADQTDYQTPLSIGSVAPDFTLPDLSGNQQTLSQWRGRKVLLIFFDLECVHCVEMAPTLGNQSADEANQDPVTLLVSMGDAGTNREFFHAHGIISPVLLQENLEVTLEYHATGTPTGYLIDEQGLIASELALGEQALLALSGTLRPPAIEDDEVLAESKAEPEDENRNGHRNNKNTGSLAKSHLDRDGLSKGTAAPAFRLQGLDNEEISLEQYRGQKVLLVFSDPECGPCNLLAPRLQELARRAPDIQLLMVSRGDPEANRLKIEEHGLKFPVALQKHWEISRRYAMFATPIAYLIDEEGIIAADVATGAEAILNLLTSAAILSLLDAKRTYGIEVNLEPQLDQPALEQLDTSNPMAT